jgi:hypothetical protein
MYEGTFTKTLEREALPGAWLAAKQGVEPRRIESRRRAGELLGVRNGRDYLYPVWQFSADGETLPAVKRVVRAADEAGLSGSELYALLQRRDGLTGGGSRLVDAVVDGRDGRVTELVQAAGGAR